jgi:hypothetical protein
MDAVGALELLKHTQAPASGEAGKCGEEGGGGGEFEGRLFLLAGMPSDGGPSFQGPAFCSSFFPASSDPADAALPTPFP